MIAVNEYKNLDMLLGFFMGVFMDSNGLFWIFIFFEKIVNLNNIDSILFYQVKS